VHCGSGCSDDQNTYFLFNFFNVKFTLRNLIPRSKSSLLDRGLAEFIFPNATFTFVSSECFCCRLGFEINSSFRGTTYSRLRYDWHLLFLEIELTDFEILLTTGIDDFTFLNCGDAYNYQPNFLALFIPYTKVTWALIFMTIFGWPLVLSLIENEFNWKNVLKDFDALFIVWAMILEQSHLRATNYKGRGPLYCYCGCVLLAVFILSNAYKGDNIQTLTKAFELVPLTHIEQLIKAGSHTYTIQYCDALGGGGFDCITEFESEKEGRRNQYTDEQFKLWKPIGLYPNHGSFSTIDVDSFEKCPNKKALLGWRSDLELLQNKVRQNQTNANIYIGQEFIYTRRKGWQLKRYGSVKVLKRMWTLVESGVYNEMHNISYKPLAAKVFEPSRLTIHGKIFIQFDFHSVGLLFALLVFVVELHKRIALCFNSVRLMCSLLVRNFFYQCQKVFLFGWKFYSRTRNGFAGYCHCSKMHRYENAHASSKSSKRYT